MTGLASTRPYRAGDEAACLAIFDGNLPDFFAASERVEFQGFLAEGPSTPFLVLESGGEVIACGGVSVGPEGWVALDWGMVARGRQGAGLGRLLVEARLDLARELQCARGVRLATSQKTRGFYERFGFVVTEVVPDGFGPGLDRVDMVLRF